MSDKPLTDCENVVSPIVVSPNPNQNLSNLIFPSTKLLNNEGSELDFAHMHNQIINNQRTLFSNTNSAFRSPLTGKDDYIAIERLNQLRYKSRSTNEGTDKENNNDQDLFNKNLQSDKALGHQQQQEKDDTLTNKVLLFVIQNLLQQNQNDNTVNQKNNNNNNANNQSQDQNQQQKVNSKKNANFKYQEETKFLDELHIASKKRKISSDSYSRISQESSDSQNGVSANNNVATNPLYQTLGFPLKLNRSQSEYTNQYQHQFQTQSPSTNDADTNEQKSLKGTATNGGIQKTKTCNCKKTKCLKLYCECFANGELCGEDCKCLDCCNNQHNQKQRNDAIESILERQPDAFSSKYHNKSQNQNSVQSTPNSAHQVAQNTQSVNAQATQNSSGKPAVVHKKGCNCKKSNCLKKYCECYSAGIGCSEHCKCEDCKNNSLEKQMLARFQKRAPQGNGYLQEPMSADFTKKHHYQNLFDNIDIESSTHASWSNEFQSRKMPSLQQRLQKYNSTTSNNAQYQSNSYPKQSFLQSNIFQNIGITPFENRLNYDSISEEEITQNDTQTQQQQLQQQQQTPQQQQQQQQQKPVIQIGQKFDEQSRNSFQRSFPQLPQFNKTSSAFSAMEE